VHVFDAYVHDTPDYTMKGRKLKKPKKIRSKRSKVVQPVRNGAEGIA
jgi:hypothetical protein